MDFMDDMDDMDDMDGHPGKLPAIFTSSQLHARFAGIPSHRQCKKIRSVFPRFNHVGGVFAF